jgi:hypothetical protein
VEADMPNPPTGDEKFVVCIEFDGPLTDEQFDQIRKDLKYCVKKAQGKITDNRVAEK